MPESYHYQRIRRPALLTGVTYTNRTFFTLCKRSIIPIPFTGHPQNSEVAKNFGVLLCKKSPAHSLRPGSWFIFSRGHLQIVSGLSKQAFIQTLDLDFV